MAVDKRVTKIEVGPASSSPLNVRIVARWVRTSGATGQSVTEVAKSTLTSQGAVEAAITAVDADIDWSL